MECAAIVPKAVLTGSQLPKVLGSLWDRLIVQLEYYATRRLRVDGNVKLCNMTLALHAAMRATLRTHENVRPSKNDMVNLEIPEM